MCGINGIFAYGASAPPIDEAELLRTRQHMARRGPDGEGLWISTDRRLALGHRRLAIIDLSEAGAQPMSTRDGLLTITFNGEIYNYRQLRRALEAKGYAFRTQSDTEVLLHLYAEHGTRMVRQLRGMYAFAIWDARDQSLFLARDPFGIKPLYYSDAGGTFRFASQVKALLAGGAIDRAPEPAGSAGFLLWGCVPEPYTLYRNVRALCAGATLRATRDGVREPEIYFSVRDELLRAQADAGSGSSGAENLGEVLLDTVKCHLVSDVPVGVFLSAGVDSTLVTTLARQQEGPTLRTLTLGFREYRGLPDDEVPIAERTASSLGTRHETHWISREDFAQEAESILAAMDQPTTDGVNTYFVCRAARRAGITVAMSGLGGDELFGGYPSFSEVPRIARWLPAGRATRLLGRMGRKLLAPLLGIFTSPKYAGLLEYGGRPEGAYLLRRALFMPWEVGEILDPVTVHVGLERLSTLPALATTIDGVASDHARVAALEMSWYMRNQLLRDADWAGMAHSVEIRVPFVDVDVFRKIAPRIISEAPPSKSDAAESIASPVLQEILRRPKTGFSVPVREWLAGGKSATGAQMRGLRGWARTVLPPQSAPFRVLALVSDAYGGHGGIAKFNRDLLAALASMPDCANVVVIPRRLDEPPGAVPERVEFRAGAAGGKFRFAVAALRECWRGPATLVLAGHINLVALSRFIAWIKGARLALVVHGIDAWSPHPDLLVRDSLHAVHRVIGVSNLTLGRFAEWADTNPQRFRVLPNCVDLALFSPGPKPIDLQRELGLGGRTVIMTLGRLASEERYKGFDEVIDVLPQLAVAIPNVAYLICGEGPDRPRLEAKIAAMGMGDFVHFAGFVDERRKADYYRLADAYVMPSRGEGFGIVFLEALACGLPVLGSAVDGGREALRDGALGELVDPAQLSQLVPKIVATLRRGRGRQPGLDYFAVPAFRERVTKIVSDLLAATGPRGAQLQRSSNGSLQ